MNEQTTPQPGNRASRLISGLNIWLQLFLTIIAGVIVAVIVWTIIERFMHIVVLLLASFLLAYLLAPIVDRLSSGKLPRVLAIALLYLVILGVLGIGITLLIGPLTGQLQGLIQTLPTLTDSKSPALTSLDSFFRDHNIALSVNDLRTKATEYISGAGTQLLGGTLAVVAGLVTFVTDLLLILAITFYLLLDGHSMHNSALRLLPTGGRERWFFIEATLNKVVGGYIRGQLIVAVTVGMAAGLGSFALGIQYPLVIGLLAFVFEFIPMLGPVLGMIPAVILALFQSPTLALWAVVYFIVLQQVESNVIVPRVSGHAVGLHPLAALLALLLGFEIGGLGGALLAVPLAGVIYVMGLAFYSDATGHTDLLVPQQRPTAYTAAYSSLRRVIGRREQHSGGIIAPAAPSVGLPTVLQSNGASALIIPTAASEVAPTVPPPGNERLASLAQDQAQLIAQYEADERDQAVADQKEAEEIKVEDEEAAVKTK